MKIHAHIIVRRRFVALNVGEAQNSRGTESRAYYSVNGVNSSEPNAINARSAAAIARE